jgi:dipeptidyl aminopeptidase/acylaminoacyl peptidase
VLISTAPGARTLRRIADSPHANAGAAIFHPVTWEPQLVSFDYLKPNWTLLDLALAPDWAQLTAFRPDAVPTITSRSYDSAAWLVQYGADNATTGSYLYRPGAPGPPQLLFETQPELKAHRLASMHPVVFAACDGLRIPAYLTLPVRPGVPAVLPACVAGDVPDATPAARAAAAASPLACPLGLKLPLVLLVHGGPWSRDTWGVDSVVQLLANRGYAVLQVNYRGSTGYGKRFTNAGNGQWGVGAMQHDLTDAVRWAIEKGVAHPRRVCIMGGSYGGYAALAGLTFTPELYACGLDLVGISNVGTFMKSIPPYWEPMLQDFISRVGDVASNDTLNRAISPLFHVQRVRAPLLIGQGANDPRVPQAESDQMFKAMKARGLDVTYVLYPDEGHGLVRPDNRLDFYSRVEQFLARHLGGRAQPPPALPGSTARVVAAVA